MLLTQSGTTKPNVVKVLENTLGDITFTYSGVGQYTVTGAGLFTLDKTDITFGDVRTSAHDWCSIYVDSSTLTLNSFVINVHDITNTAQNGVMNHTSMTIEVYN